MRTSERMPLLPPLVTGISRFAVWYVGVQMVRTFAVVLLLTATVANTQPHLVFDHKIGNDWPLNSNRWMSFVAISSDGRTVVGDASGLLKKERLGFWTFPDGKALRSIDGVPAAISPDFRYLILENQILDLQSGKPILSVAHTKDTLGFAAFSADSELAAVNARPHLVRGSQLAILRSAVGAVLSSFGARSIRAMAFVPDGHTIVTGHWNNLTLWDVQTGERLALLMSAPRKVDPEDPGGYWRDGRYLGAVAVSPDGKRIAAGSDDGELQVWNFATRKLVHTTSLSRRGDGCGILPRFQSHCHRIIPRRNASPRGRCDGYASIRDSGVHVWSWCSGL